MYQNPITGITFGSKQDYAESLITEYQKVVRLRFNLDRDDKDLVDAMNELADCPEVAEGTIAVAGTTQKFKIKRRVNVRYERDRGAPHPLKLAMDQNEQVAEMVRIDYKEKGTQIAKLLSDDPDSPLLDLLRDCRKVAAGKPTVSFEGIENG